MHFQVARARFVIPAVPLCTHVRNAEYTTIPSARPAMIENKDELIEEISPRIPLFLKVTDGNMSPVSL